MMSNNWHMIRIGYTKELENGAFSKVQENYLISGDCFCSAENRMVKEAENFVRGDLEIRSIQKKKIQDIFRYSDSVTWYLVNVTCTLSNPDLPKPKKTNQQYMVTAGNVALAADRVEEQLKDMLWVDVEVKRTKIALIEEIYYPDKDDINKKIKEINLTA